MRISGLAAVAAIGAVLASCGNGESAVETRERAEGNGSAQGLVAASVEADSAYGAAGSAAPYASPTNAPKPVMTSNRRETTDAKVQRLFERNGRDFNAANAEDYLTKVQAFIGSPPAGTEQVSRPNGDVLMYHAASNTFAVVSKDGVPKTMFKPRDGARYWAEQKDAAPTFGQRRSND